MNERTLGMAWEAKEGQSQPSGAADGSVSAPAGYSRNPQKRERPAQPECHPLKFFIEAAALSASAIPRQLLTMAGYPWADEKNAPREQEARILGGIYAHILLSGFRGVNNPA